MAYSATGMWSWLTKHFRKTLSATELAVALPEPELLLPRPQGYKRGLEQAPCQQCQKQTPTRLPPRCGHCGVPTPCESSDLCR